ncbi:hypothetical protein [Streptomyces sp. NPDC101115]|uniref:hypothetical protein n=1 Tax=Streptomyces sp. NPDC101115 TaxID=3366106 RepID=UPI00381AAD15
MNKRRTARIAFSSLAVAGMAFAGAVPAHADSNPASDTVSVPAPDSAFVIEWKSGPTGIEITPHIPDVPGLPSLPDVPPLVIEWK